MAVVNKTPEQQARHEQRLEDLMFKSYGQLHNFPKVRYGLQQCLNALATYVTGWEGIGVKRQFEIAQSAYIVATASVTLTVNQVRIGDKNLDVTSKNSLVRHALDFGYTKPPTIALDAPNQKVLT